MELFDVAKGWKLRPLARGKRILRWTRKSELVRFHFDEVQRRIEDADSAAIYCPLSIYAKELEQNEALARWRKVTSEVQALEHRESRSAFTLSEAARLNSLLTCNENIRMHLLRRARTLTRYEIDIPVNLNAFQETKVVPAYMTETVAEPIDMADPLSDTDCSSIPNVLGMHCSYEINTCSPEVRLHCVALSALKLPSIT